MRKNITLSADDQIIRKARIKAQRENTSLNSIFRQWNAKIMLKKNRFQVIGYSLILVGTLVLIFRADRGWEVYLHIGIILILLLVLYDLIFGFGKKSRKTNPQ